MNYPASAGDIGSIYTQERYRYEWPVSFFDRIKQNKRNTVLLVIGLLVINTTVFGIYSALAGVLLKTTIYNDFSWVAIVFLLVTGSIIGLVISLVAYFTNKMSEGSKFLSLVGAVSATDPRIINIQSIINARNMIENMSIAGGMPPSSLYIVPNHNINAFAIGNKHSQGAVVLTVGAIDKLSPSELEAVIAHEMAHIRNLDSLLITTCLSIAAIAMAATEVTGRLLFSGAGRSPLILLGIIIWLFTAIFSFLSMTLVRAGISQEREFLADATAAKMTRNPDALAKALHKISSQKNRVINNNSIKMEPLFIISPLDGSDFLSRVFRTHPPTEERIRRLLAN